MITIQTRQNKHGLWWCNTTFNCEDIFTVGTTIENAKREMIEAIVTKRGASLENILWDSPKEYPKEVKPFKSESKIWRLDTGMV